MYHSTFVVFKLRYVTQIKGQLFLCCTKYRIYFFHLFYTHSFLADFFKFTQAVTQFLYFILFNLFAGVSWSKSILRFIHHSLSVNTHLVFFIKKMILCILMGVNNFTAYVLGNGNRNNEVNNNGATTEKTYASITPLYLQTIEKSFQ